MRILLSFLFLLTFRASASSKCWVDDGGWFDHLPKGCIGSVKKLVEVQNRGSNSICAIKGDDGVWCLRYPVPAWVGKAKDIAGSSDLVCIVTTEDQLKCWNPSTQLEVTFKSRFNEKIKSVFLAESLRGTIDPKDNFKYIEASKSNLFGPRAITISGKVDPYDGLPAETDDIVKWANARYKIKKVTVRGDLLSEDGYLFTRWGASNEFFSNIEDLDSHNCMQGPSSIEWILYKDGHQSGGSGVLSVHRPIPNLMDFQVDFEQYGACGRLHSGKVVCWGRTGFLTGDVYSTSNVVITPFYIFASSSRGIEVGGIDGTITVIPY